MKVFTDVITVSWDPFELLERADTGNLYAYINIPLKTDRWRNGFREVD